MFQTTSPKIVFLLLLSLFCMFFLLSYFSTGTYDTGDGICHYNISRYSWQHPYLFLDSWGKPFFTLISSPFSQFGLLGLNVFNILCALFSAFICFKIAKLKGYSYPIIIIVFLCFSPVYFPAMNSGLTEPFFGLVLIASIYIFISGYFRLALILVSFLPFVRTEGFLILPVFAVVLAIFKEYKLILRLALGSLIYSIIGFFHYKDFFWIIHQNPYNGNGGDVYGHGELLHFVNAHYFIWGTALTVLFLCGILYTFYYFISATKLNKYKLKLTEMDYSEAILVYGSFFVYFIAHSFMWWKGVANSLGLVRVIAAVMPCSAIICANGFELIMGLLQRKKILQTFIAITILVSVIIAPFQQDYFPYKANTEQTIINNAGDWFLTSPYKNKTIYYEYPYLAYVINADPFNTIKNRHLVTVYNPDINTMPDSSIIFWDGHFGPNECRIPLAKIMNDSNFSLIKSFIPPSNVATLNNTNFAIYVFTKLHSPTKSNVLRDSINSNAVKTKQD